MLDSEYTFQQNIKHIYENTHAYMGQKGNYFSLNKGKKTKQNKKISLSFNDYRLKMSNFEAIYFQHRLCESSVTYWVMNHNVLGFVFVFAFFVM